jgi:hypothetical protein
MGIKATPRRGRGAGVLVGGGCWDISNTWGVKAAANKKGGVNDLGNCDSDLTVSLLGGGRPFYAPCIFGMSFHMSVRAWRIKRAAVTKRGTGIYLRKNKN